MGFEGKIGLSHQAALFLFILVSFGEVDQSEPSPKGAGEVLHKVRTFGKFGGFYLFRHGLRRATFPKGEGKGCKESTFSTESERNNQELSQYLAAQLLVFANMDFWGISTTCTRYSGWILAFR
jgi:hypothetical protein